MSLKTFWPRLNYAPVRTALAVCCVLLTSPPPAHADAALLLAAPYGRSGSFNPTGHVGVYLSRVCAETPTRLRRCVEGEAGVVISRYNRVGSLDWVAIPLQTPAFWSTSSLRFLAAVR